MRVVDRAAFPTLPDYRKLADVIRDMGLTVMSYQDVAVGGCWVPGDIMGTDLTLIRWRTASEGNYRFDGWEPQHTAFRHGGRYVDLACALGWVAQARKPVAWEGRT